MRRDGESHGDKSTAALCITCPIIVVNEYAPVCVCVYSVLKWYQFVDVFSGVRHAASHDVIVMPVQW